MSHSQSPKNSPVAAGHPLVQLQPSLSNTASDYLDDIDLITVSNLTSARRGSSSISPRPRMSPTRSGIAKGRDPVPPPPASLAALRASPTSTPVAATASQPARGTLARRGSAAPPHAAVSTLPAFAPAHQTEGGKETHNIAVGDVDNDLSVTADDVVPMSSNEESPNSFTVQSRRTAQGTKHDEEPEEVEEAMYPVEDPATAVSEPCEDEADADVVHTLPVPVPLPEAFPTSESNPTTTTTTTAAPADGVARQRRGSNVMLPVPERVLHARRRSLLERGSSLSSQNDDRSHGSTSSAQSPLDTTADATGLQTPPSCATDTHTALGNASTSNSSRSPVPVPPPGAVRVEQVVEDDMHNDEDELDHHAMAAVARGRRGTLPGNAAGTLLPATMAPPPSPPPAHLYPGSDVLATMAAATTPTVRSSRVTSPEEGSLAYTPMTNTSLGAATNATHNNNNGAPSGQTEIVVAARVRPPHTSREAPPAQAASKSRRAMHRKRPDSYLRVDAPHGVIECVGAVGTVDSGKTTTTAAAAPERSPTSPALTTRSQSSAAAAATTNTTSTGRGALNFHFANVFDENATQADVMNVVGTRAVDQVLAGYNGTVLCYGQSGCGKTHTMYGPRGGRMPEADTIVAQDVEADVAATVGLAPRMLLRLFHALEQRQAQQQQQQQQATSESARSGAKSPTAAGELLPFQVTISALELYNEELRDLLPGPTLLKRLIAKRAKKLAHKIQKQHVDVDENEDEDDADEEEEYDEEEAVDAAEQQLPPSQTPTSESQGSATPVQGALTPTAADQNTPTRRVLKSVTRGKSMPVGATSATSPTRTTTTNTTTAAATTTTTTTASPHGSPRQKKRAKSAAATPSSAAASANLVIRSGAPDNITKMSVHVAGLQSHTVASFEEAMLIVHAALHARSMGATRLNVDSNRAHMLLFVRVRQQQFLEPAAAAAISPGRGTLNRRLQTSQSVLTLADLAGSERVSRTGADGVRLREAQSINLSLSTLSNVIRRLAAQSKAEAAAEASRNGSFSAVHIPYRDSKLTRILQDSFGGNAVTFLLCNVSSDECDFQETISALRFATDAKQVKNRIVRNTATSTQTLERENAALQKASVSLQSSLEAAKSYIAWLEHQLRFFSRQCVLLLDHQDEDTTAVLDGIAARIEAEKQAAGVVDAPSASSATKEVSGGGGSGDGDGGSADGAMPVQAQVREVYALLQSELERQRERQADLRAEPETAATRNVGDGGMASERSANATPLQEVEDDDECNASQASPDVASPPSSVNGYHEEDEEGRRDDENSHNRDDNRLSTPTEKASACEYAGVVRALQDERDAREADRNALSAAVARATALEDDVAEKETVIQALQALLDEKYREEDVARERKAAEEDESALDMIAHYGNGNGDDDVTRRPRADSLPASAINEHDAADASLRHHEEEAKEQEPDPIDIEELLADYRSEDSGPVDQSAAEANTRDVVMRLPADKPAVEMIAVETQTELCGILDPIPVSNMSSERGVRHTDLDGDHDGTALAPLMLARSVPSWQSAEGSDVRFISRGASPPVSSLRASRRLWAGNSRDANIVNGVGAGDDNGHGPLVQSHAPGRLQRLLAGFRLAAALAKSEPNMS